MAFQNRTWGGGKGGMKQKSFGTLNTVLVVRGPYKAARKEFVKNDILAVEKVLRIKKLEQKDE